MTADHEQDPLKFYQLHLHALPGDRRPHDVVALSELSKSARNKLARVTHQHDGRAFRVNASKVNSLDPVGDWTGVQVDGLGSVISIATSEAFILRDAGLSILPSSTTLLHETCLEAFYDDPVGLVVNRSRVNSLNARDPYSLIISEQTHEAFALDYPSTPGPLQPAPPDSGPFGLPSKVTNFHFVGETDV